MPLISRIVIGNFNGGTVTNPVVVDLSADVADRTALDVIQPASFGFGVRPFRFRQTDFAYLQMETSGAVSTAGNDLTTAGGTLRVTTAGGVTEHELGPGPPAAAGLFATVAAAQPPAITDAAGGAIIDAEARTALNSLLAAVRTLGLVAT